MSDRDADMLVGLMGYNLRRATAVFLADYAASLGAGALRPTQVAVLATLRSRGPTGPTEIGRLLSIKKTNATPLLAELERAGLIERAEAPADRRSKSLRLSPLGETRLIETEAQVRSHEDRLLSGFSPVERETLLSLLRRIWVDDRG